MFIDRALRARQMAETDAALNGAHPEFYRFISAEDLQQRGNAVVQEAVMQQRQLSATYQKIYQLPDGSAWLVGWRVQPAKEAPFVPPMTLEPVR